MISNERLTMEAIIEVAVVEKTPNRRPLRLSKLILVYCYFTVLRQFTLAPVWPDGKNFFQHTAIWNNGNLPNSIKIAKEGAFFCLKLNEVSKNWPKTHEIFPKWQNLVKYGHTDWRRQQCVHTELHFINNSLLGFLFFLTFYFDGYGDYDGEGKFKVDSSCF